MAEARAAKSVKASPRRSNVVRGRGDYYTTFGKFGQKAGHIVGGVADTVEAAAKYALPYVAPLLGFGDYVQSTYPLKKNTLAMGNDPPVIKNAKDGRTILRHREYLQDIVTGAAGEFNINSFVLQPGNQATFPWLSQVAQAFEQYKLRGVIFEFKSTSADALNSTNTALGTVIMATQYDVAKAPFVNKAEMENHVYATAARQSCSMLHPIECARSASPLDELYIRTGPVVSGSDVHLYDFANFFIATMGQQGSNINIGELWVTYEIELLKPQINEIGSLQQSAVFRQENSSCTTAAYFGDLTLVEASTRNNIDIQLVEESGQLDIIFPKGTVGSFLIMFEVNGNTSTVNLKASDINALNDGVLTGAVNDPFDGHMFAPDTPKTGLRIFSAAIVNCRGFSSTGEAPAVKLDGATFPTSSLSAYLYITAVVDAMGVASFVTPPALEEEFKEYQRIEYDNFVKMRQMKKVKTIDINDEKWISLSPEKLCDECHDAELDKKYAARKEEVDLSQSTLSNIQEIVEKARAKKALEIQQGKK
nr:MAG: putative capsid protein [Arizlama virus]